MTICNHERVRIFIMLLVEVCLLLPSISSGDSMKSRKGLAARYIGDEGLEKNPDVNVFKEI